ncbi:MAG: molecular chaperone GrpE [Rhodospirillales bacterium]|nr:molecular chaperone GrpE [Rhodospirillales bacterium]
MTKERERGEETENPPGNAPPGTPSGSERVIEETSIESFPASDPPAWTPVLGTGAAASGLEAEVLDLKDRLLRALAEQENIRRRAAREREEAVRFAASKLVTDLLPTADNLRRAIESVAPERAGADEMMGNLLAGVEVTERALLNAFERHDIHRIEPEPGEAFDPHRHQAMLEVLDSGLPDGSVAQVLQLGYLHHDRLLRPALVGVARNGDGGMRPAT